MGQLPPAVIDTKVCTFADPNGTKSRIYTQSVSATPAKIPPPEGLGPIEFKSAKLKGAIGPVEGTVKYDEKGFDYSGKAKWKPEAEKPGEKKKMKLKLEGEGEVCVKKKNGTKDGKGSWFTYELQGLGGHLKVGMPDGDFCVGGGTDYLKPGGSIEMGGGGE